MVSQRHVRLSLFQTRLAAQDGGVHERPAERTVELLRTVPGQPGGRGQQGRPHGQYQGRTRASCLEYVCVCTF